MKPILIQLGLAAIVIARTTAATTSTLQELHLRADLDADGRDDIAVINRADGSFRIGYQLAPGQMTWSQSRASGAPGASWATSGDLSGYEGSLAISATESNLVSICAAPLPNSAVLPIITHPSGIGPAGVVALDIGGAGNTSDDDLVVFTRENGDPTPHCYDLMRHKDGGGVDSYTALSQMNAQEFFAGDRVIAKDGGTPLLAVLEGTPFSASLRLLDASSGTLIEQASAVGLPSSGFVSGRFAASVFHQFFFWQSGDATIEWRPTAASGVDGVQFLAGGLIDAGMPVGEIVLLSDGVAERLLIVSSDGKTALILDFDGTEATEVESITAPEGSDFTGAFAREGGAFTLLSGLPGSGLSTRSQGWETSGSGYVIGESEALPGVRPAGTRANVFLFASEPFVVPDPGLLGKLNAPEWSSDVVFNGNPASVSATTEIYIGEGSGLGAPTPHPLGEAPAGANFALSNQLQPQISLGSFQSLLGYSDLKVSIAPPSGSYSVAVSPVVTASSATAQVFARVGSGQWTPAADLQARLTSDALVQFYAQSADGLRRTPIGSASYTFTVEPNLIDSDGDGVPDFVELTAVPPKGQDPPLDPNSGQDPDGDGFTDLEEWLAGTNPLDFEDRPGARSANGGSFIVRAAPRPLDGTTSLASTAVQGVHGEVRTPGGKNLGSDATGLDVAGFLGTPAFEVSRLITDSPLSSVLTQAVFDIATPDPNKNRGRELGALFAVPRTALPSIDYTPGGGTLAQEVAAWKAAAQAAATASQPAVVALEPSEHDVLIALIFERWLNAVALDRGIAGATANNVSVFPSRPGEAGQRSLTPEEIDSLSVHLGDLMPGWDVVVVLEALNSADILPIKAVATDIYRISSLLGIGDNAPDYLPPLDVLREFVRSGQLPVAYATASSLSPADRTAAFQNIATLLATLSPRPVETVDLLVTEDTFSGACPTLDRIGQPGEVSLLQTVGVPYNFPDSFTLVPGARIRVTGHTDVIDPDCPGDEIVVLSMSVIFLPVPAGNDDDNNLLHDDWECFFFGGGDPLGDTDGDGFSNLQELLDGTDPLLAESKGTLPADLSPPNLMIDFNDADNLLIEWDYPANYSGKISFEIVCGNDLKGFIPANIVPQEQDGHYSAVIPIPPQDDKFYRVQLSLTL